MRALLVVGAGLLVTMLVGAEVGEAHKPITSKYTYNDDVFPILRDRCGKCHVTGGVAPMSLLTYDEAFPWAESIRAELISARMPPWHAEEGFGDLKIPQHTLSARELDVVLVWASGGVPQGSPTNRPAPVTFENTWPLGKPDLALPLAATFTLAADKMEDTREFVLQTQTKQDRWIKAVDLLPGTPAIVRNAWIFVKENGVGSLFQGESAKNTPDPFFLAVWLPGQEPVAVGDGAGFRLPAGAELVVRIHYRKTWKYEGKPVDDRSTVGVYFQDRPTDREVRGVLVASSPIVSSEVEGRTITFSGILDEDVQALALRSGIDRPNIELKVEAVRPDGSRAPMIRLTTQPDWQQRCWFERPLSLPRGSRIDVTATFKRPDEASLGLAPAVSSQASTAASAGDDSRLRLWVDVVPAQAKRAAK